MIKGASVTLGPLLPNDFPLLFLWADDFEAARLNEPYRPAVWKGQEEFWFGNGNDPSRVCFAIRNFDSPDIIGFVQIWGIDPVNRSALIGMRIGSAADRGKGYGSDALRLTVKYCWNQLNLSRLSLVVFETNRHAIKLYTAHGFERDGVARRAVFIDGRWLDVIFMALLHPSRTNPEAAGAAPA